MKSIHSLFISALVFSIVSVACKSTPEEPVGKDPTPNPAATPAPTTPNTPTTGATTTVVGSPAPAATTAIDLKTATDGIPGSGALMADIVTDQGTISCKLFDDKAPVTVANFVGLARGLQPFKDPSTGSWVKRPAYDGTTFHRIIKGFMIQGGDPKGNGSGDPGYTINDEIWPGSKHDHAGELCMANRGKNTNGMQFFITDDTAPHLDGNYTIFGECGPVPTIHKIASTPMAPNGETPLIKPKIVTVTIHREKVAAAASGSPVPSGSAKGQ
jgi:peptidyl-prolyl cis-trans isomerase A (cyclophilin A)